MNRLSTYFPLIIVALLAATSFWLEQVVRSESRKGLGDTRHDPDLIVHGASIDRFDVSGKRISRITAGQVQHYPDDDTADFIKPVVVLTRTARATTLNSDTAHADNLNKVVVMRGAARAERAASSDSPAQILTSEELTVFSDDEIIRTHKPLLMTQGASSLAGVGGEWNNLTGLFTLHSEVYATFAPNARTAPP